MPPSIWSSPAIPTGSKPSWAPPPANSWVVLDEIQKVPSLLDEVHRLIEARHWRFALCGSSARQLRRGGVNLLAGRALTLGMEGFSAAELGDRFDLAPALEWGTLPFVALASDDAPDVLSAYVNTCLKEEIREEGLVRQVPPFVRFETRKRQPGKPAHLVAIEVKLAEKWDTAWESPLRDLAAQPSLEVERAFCVYTGSRRYTHDDLTVLPVVDFLGALHAGQVF